VDREGLGDGEFRHGLGEDALPFLGCENGVVGVVELFDVTAFVMVTNEAFKDDEGTAGGIGHLCSERGEVDFGILNLEHGLGDLTSGEGRHKGDGLGGGDGSGPVGEFVVDGRLNVGEIESEAVTETNFFPKSGESGGGSTKNLGVGARFLGELGEVFDFEFLFNWAVLVKEFEFYEVFGTVEIEERLGIGGSELSSVERSEKTAGAAAVFGDHFVESDGGRGRVEGAEGFGMIVERVEKAGDVLFGIVVFDEGSEIFFLKAGKVDRDEEPVGRGIAFEGGLKATERAGRGF